MILFLCALGLFAVSFADQKHDALIEMDDVHILQQYDKDTFQADVSSLGKRNVFLLNFCPYSDITPEIQPGVSMRIWYMEDRVHGDCFDVSPGDNRGYTIRRGNDKKPIHANWKVDAGTGQTAAPSTTETAQSR